MEFHQQVNAKHFATAFDYIEARQATATTADFQCTRGELSTWDVQESR
jgi:hypothetical protein